MALEDDFQPRIRTAVDRSITAFNKDVLRDNPELLTKTRSGLFKAWKPEPDMELVEEVYQLLMRGWLLGMAHTSTAAGEGDFADVVADFGMTFEEALEAARGRLALTPQQFERLSDDLKLHAFTVGRLTQLDMIGKVQDAYVRQLESSGLSLDDFLKDVHELDADRVGFGGYYSTVFRTNLQKDYNAGKAYQMMQDPPMYLEFVGIDDERQSDICKARAGIILPYTDPWWDDNWPPLHYNCRSTVREVQPEEVEKLKKDFEAEEARKEREAKAAGMDYEKKKWGGLNPPQRVEEDRIGLDEDGNETLLRKNLQHSGFGRRPALDSAFWGTTQSQQQRVADLMIQDEINSVAGQTICKDFSSPKAGFESVEVEKGGLRYDTRISKQELDVNQGLARTLAETGGYYVELRSNVRLENNTQADAWLNGVDRAEFKNLTTNRAGTIGTEIDKAVRQASVVVIGLKYNGQVRPLGRVLARKGDDMVNKHWTKEVIVVLGGKIVHLTRDDLLEEGRISEKLNGLFA